MSADCNGSVLPDGCSGAVFFNDAVVIETDCEKGP